MPNTSIKLDRLKCASYVKSWGVPMSLTQKIVLPAFLFLISGCMTLHDKKISEIESEKDCNFAQGALFYNSPYYLSDGKEHAPIARLSRLFGNYDNSIEQVRVTKEGSHLLASFYDAFGEEVINSKLLPERKYKSDSKRFIINEWSSCKPGEAGVGCSWSHIELSCTQDNNLAVKEINRGAGMIALVVPIVTSSSFMGLYKRAADKENRYTPQPIASRDAPQASRR